MRFKNHVLVVLTIMLISCNSSKEEAVTENIKENTTETTQEKNNEISSLVADSVIKILQGKWKEDTYPFRVVNFKEMTVKFIEEGLVDEPTFKEYKILKECPFEVNNITSTDPNDIFLVMTGDSTCEKLMLSDTTLILSGFSVNTKSDYRIVYKRME